MHSASSALPLDPALPEGPAHRPLQSLCAALERGRAAELPAVQGLSGAVLLRWLHRAWVQDRPWIPLVHLDPQRLDPDTLDELVAVAAGGWLHLGPGAPMPLVMELAALCGRASTLLITESAGPALEVPAAWAQRLRDLDSLHLIATDPSLHALRSSLLAYTRSGAAVLVLGEQGSGRKSLALWAHASVGSGPLALLSHEQRGRAASDRWLLVDELQELPEDALTLLRERLNERTRSSRPLSRSTPQRPQAPAFAPILGQSPALCEVLSQAELAARSPLPVLILGEPGTGKELLARAIHEHSGRTGPLIAVDVSSLSEGLVQSELFGHVRGAFTGADSARDGAFRAAEGGTLFLDEIGNLSLASQGLLLRALQEKQVRPVGGDRLVPVDVRVLAATNADLQGLVQRGLFRADLLSRLAGVTLRLPPLRERDEDIQPVAQAMLRAARPKLPEVPWSPQAQAILLAWHWPGNLRELHHTMGWAAAQLKPGETLGPEHLGELGTRSSAPVIVVSQQEPVDGALPGLERRLASRLAAVTLRVPPLRARGPLASRSAVLSALEGSPITQGALSALEGRDWPGNLPELLGALRALRANVPGVIDLDALRRVLPSLAPTAAPGLRLLMAPEQGADGRVTGLIRDFATGLVIVGRGGDLTELERASEQDSGLLARLAELRQRAGAQRPESLSLDGTPGLSRAHLLLRATPQGVEAHVLPGAGHPVWGGALSEEAGQLQPLSPRAPLLLGAAGELQLRDARGQALLQLFVFRDSPAWERWSPQALARRVRPSALESTQREPEAEQASGRRVWVMDPEEAELLASVLRSYTGGDFQAHMRRALSRAPQAARLTAYLVGGRSAQSCGRLYAHNPEAAAALVAELGPEGLEGLPAQVRKGLLPDEDV